MSWGAVILKIKGPVRPIDEVDHDDYLPLGSLESVAQKIRDAFPGAEWDDPSYARFGLDDDTGVMINMDHVEESHSIQVDVSGSGNPIPCLLALANAHGWVVLECGSGEFLGKEDVTSDDWDGYQRLFERDP